MKNKIFSSRLSLSYIDFVMLFVLSINYLILYNVQTYNLLYPFFTYIAILFLGIMFIGFLKIKIGILEIEVVSLILGTAFVNTRINGLAIGEFFLLVWFYGMYIIISKVNNDLTIQRILLCVNLLVHLYLFLYSLFNVEKFEMAIESQNNVASKTGILNPNEVGFGLTMLFWLIIYFSSFFKPRKIILVMVVFSTILGVYCSKSRACLLIFLASVLLYVIGGTVIKKNKSIALLLLIGIVVLGFVFPIIYVKLWHKLGFRAEFMGKPLFTGRERIWDAIFSYMKAHPHTLIFGTGKVKEIFWHDKFNLHNSYIALYSMFGLFPFIGHIFFIIHSVNKAYKINGYLSSRQLCLYIMIFAIFVFGVVETNFTYILSVVFSILAISFINNEKRTLSFIKRNEV